MATMTPGWENEIRLRFEDRDCRESQSFELVFQNYAFVQERLIKLLTECSQLKRVNKILEKKNQTLSIQAEASGSLKSIDMEHKLFRLQEEVTELHREKGKLAFDVIELNKSCNAKDKLLKNQASKLEEFKQLVDGLSSNNRSCMAKIDELAKENQLLLDEQAATMLTVKSLESRHRLLEEDNTKLIRQISCLQLEIEELKKSESDMKFRLKREEIEKGLREAARAPSSLDAQSPDKPLFTCLVSLPTKAVSKLDASEDVNCVRFSPSGKTFCSGGSDNKVWLWKNLKGKWVCQSPLVGCNAAVSAVDFTQDETMVLGASSDFACRVWTLSDCRLKINLTGHSERVIAARFMDDSNRMVTASADRTIKLWDLEKRQCIRTLLCASTCHDVVACGSTQRIISGHFDKKLRIWDQKAGVTTNELALSGRITGIDLSKDHCYVLACTRNDSLHMVDLRQYEVVRSFLADGFHVNSDFIRPCISPDGHYVACGSQDGGVYIWSASTGVLETVLRGHDNMVICVNWNPLGHELVSCERGKKIVVWSQF